MRAAAARVRPSATARPASRAACDRGGRRPAHAEVALDGAGDRGGGDDLAGQPVLGERVVGVELDDRVHVGGGAADVDDDDVAGARGASSRPRASSSTPVSTTSGVAPRTIAVKSARAERCLPPITWARNISRIAARAEAGREHADLRDDVVGEHVRHVPGGQDRGHLVARVDVAGDDHRTGPARADEVAGGAEQHLGVAAVGAAGQQHHVRLARPHHEGPGDPPRADDGHADDRDHLAAAGERDPAAGLGGDQLLVADDRDPQAAAGARAGQHLRVRGARVRRDQLGQARVVPVEDVGVDRGRVGGRGDDAPAAEVDQRGLGEGRAEVDADDLRDGGVTAGPTARLRSGRR